jgi:hypothetical protein
MRPITINGKPVAPQRPQHVISRSAILILSGLLIGRSINQGDLTGIAFSGMCAGIVGLLAFYVLDLAASRHCHRVARRTLADVDSVLSQRLKRHVELQSPNSGPPRPARRRLPSYAEASYLTVAHSQR